MVPCLVPKINFNNGNYTIFVLMKSSKTPVENPFKNLKYLPKPLTSVSFFVLLVAVFALFQGRKHEFFQINNIDSLFPDFYSHVSNFSISCLLYMGIGYFWLLSGMRFKYELFISVLNTRDIIDAYYGVAGTAVAFLFLFICKRFGFTLNPRVEKQTM